MLRDLRARCLPNGLHPAENGGPSGVHFDYDIHKGIFSQPINAENTFLPAGLRFRWSTTRPTKLRSSRFIRLLETSAQSKKRGGGVKGPSDCDGSARLNTLTSWTSHEDMKSSPWIHPLINLQTDHGHRAGQTKPGYLDRIVCVWVPAARITASFTN